MAKHVCRIVLSLVGEMAKEWKGRAMSLVTDGRKSVVAVASMSSVVRWEKSFLLFFLILAPGRHGAILFRPAKCVCATVTHRQLELLLSVVRKRECVSVLTQGPSDASLPSCHATSTLISCLLRPFRDS